MQTRETNIDVSKNSIRERTSQEESQRKQDQMKRSIKYFRNRRTRVTNIKSQFRIKGSKFGKGFYD